MAVDGIDRRFEESLLLQLGGPGAKFFLFFAKLGRQLGAEVLGGKDLANFNLRRAFHGIGAALDPLDRFLKRLALPDPKAGDELFCFGEGAVSDGAVLAVELNAGAFVAGMQTLAGE